MKLVIQRVREACVTSEGEILGKIGQGFLILIGVMEGDTPDLCEYLAGKTADLRVFTDEQDKLNLSLKDIGGEALVVSNFTLGGDCRKGHRPSFIRSAKPPLAEDLYELYMEKLRECGIPVKCGRFGAHMDISMTANGPITILMDTDQMKKKGQD
ncbi:MAG: D-aminoacyl-tRNA deacylase [Candidatus Merdivicinus sp.]|jgi:D-tyrosyl-tRNA(Tyr) deacylase